LKIAEETANPQFAVLGWCGLARTLVWSGDLSEARNAMAEARKHNVPRSNHVALMQSGLVELLHGERATARAFFQDALDKADALIQVCGRAYRAWESRAFAQFGLALCQEQPGPVDSAVEALRRAREITAAAGLVSRTRRLMDTLAPVAPATSIADLSRANSPPDTLH
jgi:tetratricopeptide (TPR) repeat protein